MEIKEDKYTQWDSANLHDFWRAIAIRKRLIQVYEDEKSFLLTLEGFVGSELLATNSVIVIANREHLDQLIFRLQQQNLNIPELIESGQYIPLDVADVIHTIMPDGTFDELIFNRVLSTSLEAVCKDNRHCCIYTETTSHLYQLADLTTIEALDRCWHSLHDEFQFTLFSAIPGEILPQPDPDGNYRFYENYDIVINGDIGSPMEISFRKLSL